VRQTELCLGCSQQVDCHCLKPFAPHVCIVSAAHVPTMTIQRFYSLLRQSDNQVAQCLRAWLQINAK
jgi:hypothetical protein